MNANYIFDIIRTANDNNVDLNIGLAILRGTQDVPKGTTEGVIRRFMGENYQDLIHAYKAANRAARELFAEAVAACPMPDDC